MRGKRSLLGMVSPYVGLIPAHAGKTSIMTSGSGSRPAHPRACGENIIGAVTSLGPVGSSPRMRGKHSSDGAIGLTEGLIPAHAGKTCAYRRSRAGHRAHPRACGENFTTHVLPALQSGSSPRMRGKLSHGEDAVGLLGLIPAHAGKTGA